MTSRIRAPHKPRPVEIRPETIRRRGAPPQINPSSTKVFLRDLELIASIGIHPHEHETKQRILVSVELDLGAAPGPSHDRIAEVADYQALADAIEAIVATGHVQLVETLAERIAAKCLTDKRVVQVVVRVEKPEALDNAAGAGCEIVRARG